MESGHARSFQDQLTEYQGKHQQQVQLEQKNKHKELTSFLDEVTAFDRSLEEFKKMLYKLDILYSSKEYIPQVRKLTDILNELISEAERLEKKDILEKGMVQEFKNCQVYLIQCEEYQYDSLFCIDHYVMPLIDRFWNIKNQLEKIHAQFGKPIKENLPQNSNTNITHLLPDIIGYMEANFSDKEKKLLFNLRQTSKFFQASLAKNFSNYIKDNFFVKQIACSQDFTFVLTTGGKLFLFDENCELQGDECKPILVTGDFGPVKAIAADRYSPYIICEDGSIYYFKKGNSNQLSTDQNGVNTLKSKPIHLINCHAKALAGGDMHSVVLGKNGLVYTQGFVNHYGQLGRDESLPYITGIPLVKAIAAGAEHTLLLCENGSVYAFGRNNKGQLGKREPSHSAIPTLIELPKAVKIAAGGDHSLVLCEDGSLWGFGRNGFGQLGLKEQANIFIPTQIEGLPSIESIATGTFHSLLIGKNGEVISFGRNDYGQLGYKSDDNAYVDVSGYHCPIEKPKVIPMLSAANVIAADFYSIVIEKDNSVWGFGRNTPNQLGMNDIASKVSQSTPMSYFNRWVELYKRLTQPKAEKKEDIKILKLSV